MFTLYHYVHCPFCVRVRMALGYLNIEFKSEVLSYNDEKTPIELSGKKMLPILKNTKDGKRINESLDIIKYLDKSGQIEGHGPLSTEFSNLLNELGAPIHNLCMPYWMYSKEFSKEARSYFQKKKEVKRGPFNKLIQNQEEYLKELGKILEKVEYELRPFYKSDHFTLYDICLASHLWGMYIYPEFQFSQKIHDYLQRVKEKCHFRYHDDFWKTNNDFS